MDGVITIELALGGKEVKESPTPMESMMGLGGREGRGREGAIMVAIHAPYDQRGQVDALLALIERFGQTLEHQARFEAARVEGGSFQ